MPFLHLPTVLVIQTNHSKFLIRPMLYLFDLQLPFKDPVFVFALLLLIIFFMPILLRKLRIPSIVGLILAGVVIGPKGFSVLEFDAAMKLLGTVGLLYIMFLAGLEIDFRDFQRTATKASFLASLHLPYPSVLALYQRFMY
jgi:Kef-type K+ transport system membrane component KefB